MVPNNKATPITVNSRSSGTPAKLHRLRSKGRTAVPSKIPATDPARRAGYNLLTAPVIAYSSYHVPAVDGAAVCKRNISNTPPSPASSEQKT